MMKIAIIGAGAAGLMCACMLDKRHDIVVFEKNEMSGKKLLITGGGRCNLTNLCEPDIFLKSVAQNARFFEYALTGFSPQNTVDFFEKELGVAIQIENGNRVFPSNGKALRVRNAMLSYAINKGVKMNMNSLLDIKVSNHSFLKVADRFEICVGEANVGQKFDVLIVATGGVSYPQTGSTGDGYAIARSFGHEVVEPRASLCGLVLKQPAGFEGTSIRCDAEILNEQLSPVAAKETGDMLFTKNGVSGPLIHKLTAKFKGQSIRNHCLKINFAPNLNEKIFYSALKLSANDKPFYLLRKFVPINIANLLIAASNLPNKKNCSSLTKQEQEKLFKVLTGAIVTIADFESITTATITRGGIDIKNIYNKTMQSTLIKNLYFIGEVLDVDALSGGFNLQIAFSTAAMAAKAINSL